jgi:DNA-binding NarL/FixJ family response regulator
MKTASDQKMRILILDDHQIVRQGIIRIINQEPDMEVCGEAGDASKALEVLESKTPDVVVADISLPGMNGLEFLKHVKANHPTLPVVVLSMHDEALYAERALRAGALAYVMKKESSDEMLQAIRKARRGEYHVSETVGGGIFQKFLGTKRPVESSVAVLSDRELEVFELLGRGRGSREIAEELHLSVKTVDTHRAHIKEKLNLRTAPEMIRYAVQWVERESGGAK